MVGIHHYYPNRNIHTKRTQRSSAMVPLSSVFLLAASILLQAQPTSSLVLSSSSDGKCLDRRSAFWHGAAVAAGTTVSSFVATPLLGSTVAHAEDIAVGADVTVVPPTKAVLVLGANGGTGRRVVQTLIGSQSKRPCIATTRSGTLNYDVGTSSVQTLAVDVSNLGSVRSAMNAVPNLGAVVFCASSSDNSFAVDRDGVINAAQCCIEQRIPRLVIVSSGAVSRPDSPVYLLLNTVTKGIMEAKIQGEDAVRQLYRDPNQIERGIGYTIIRPGGLTTEEPVGASGLELNQGDTKSGRLSRDDVASLCVQCLESPYTFDTTFECYDSDTAKPLESVGLSNILKLRDPTPFKSGRECQGATWDDVFHGLSRDTA